MLALFVAIASYGGLLISPAVTVCLPGLLGVMLLFPGVMEIPFAIHVLFGAMIHLSLCIFVGGVRISVARIRSGLMHRIIDLDAGVFLVIFKTGAALRRFFVFCRGLPYTSSKRHSVEVRAVIQRVSNASVVINEIEKDRISAGLLVLLAAEEEDTQDDVQWLSGKITRLRLFEDHKGLMNQSIQEVGGEIMVISQFTLYASTKKGNRPSFLRSAKPNVAIPLYERFLKQLETDLGKPVASGEFGADMKVSLTNDGPVTIIIDTKNRE